MFYNVGHRLCILIKYKDKLWLVCNTCSVHKLNVSYLTRNNQLTLLLLKIVYNNTT